jgi:hypothetical protein
MPHVMEQRDDDVARISIKKDHLLGAQQLLDFDPATEFPTGRVEDARDSAVVQLEVVAVHKLISRGLILQVKVAGEHGEQPSAAAFRIRDEDHISVTQLSMLFLFAPSPTPPFLGSGE